MIAVVTTALALLLVTWFVYPLVLVLLASLRRPLPPVDSPPPYLSVIVATRDHPDAVRKRVDDLQSGQHPLDRMEIIVGVDPGAAWDLDAYRAALPSSVTVVAGDGPPGKPGNLNAAVRASSHPILVFADTGQRFAADAIPKLVEDFAHPEVGAVSGGYRITRGNPVTRAYWKLERLLRRSESRLHSMVGVTGAIYAARRELWEDLPPDLLCDDVYFPLQVAMNGHRVRFREDALATDPREFTHTQEYRRKVRTQAGILQICQRLPGVLVPWRNPIWAQFVFHKLFRMATPAFLIPLGIGVAWLAIDRMPAWTWLGRGLWFWGAVAAGALLLGARFLRPVRMVLSEITWTLVLLAAPLVAAYRAFRGQWDIWK